MAEEVLKYLPNVPELNKKKNQAEQLKKPQIVDKEVLNLTGGLFPARLVDPNIQLIVNDKIDEEQAASRTTCTMDTRTNSTAKQKAGLNHQIHEGG